MGSEQHTHSYLCRHCDCLVPVANNDALATVRCPNCGAVLVRHESPHPKTVAVIAISAFILLLDCMFEPFMSVSVGGIVSSMSLWSIFTVLQNGWILLLTVFNVVTMVFPVYMLGMICLIGFLNYRPSVRTARIYSFTHAFCLIDVLILGIAVSLIKLTQLADVRFYSGFFIAIAYSVLLLWCWGNFRPERVWEMIMPQAELEITGERGSFSGVKHCLECGMDFPAAHAAEADICPRCGSKVFYRKLNSLQRLLALLLAALILFLPSNLYPIMFTSYLGSSSGSNIVEGAISLWNMGSWFVAGVIVIASLFIPAFKIIALGYLMFKVKFGTVNHPHMLSRLYHYVAFVGKWSMIDVFVVIIMTSAVRMGSLMTIDPGFAVITFCSVVFITMFAASSFDERMIWDRSFEKQP